MARLLSLLILAAAGACAPSRADEADSATPAWFATRIAEAEASAQGFPELADFPERIPTGSSTAAWRQGIAEVEQMRRDVLDDPAMVDPDAVDDAEAFARQSRDDAAADLERQGVDD